MDLATARADPGSQCAAGSSSSRALNAIAGDLEPFAPLYSAGPEGAFLSASIGLGWRVQPTDFPASIVGSAARELLFFGGDVQSADELAGGACTVLDQMTSLLAGEAVEVPALMAFAGIAFEADTNVELPWGLARNASDFERSIHPFSDRSASLMIETPIPATLRIGEPDGEQNFDASIMQRAVLSAALLPLAALLAIERERYIAAEWLWQTVLFPASIGSSYSGGRLESSRMDPFIQPIVLTSDERARLTEWSVCVDEHYDPSMDVAIRRGLSAVRERSNTEDALIDAVIAMESLFGHGGETEVNFRVTSAIALLLEDQPAARAAFRGRLGKIYASRSKVVHGGVLEGTRLHEHKEEAIGVMVRSFRALFERTPHLIPDKDRGMRVILRTDEADD